MQFLEISNSNDFQEVLTASEDAPVVVFKHSIACDLSARAYSSLADFDPTRDPKIYLVVVQTARPLSNEIEEFFGIRHESPQIIVIDKGQAVFNDSHRNATLGALQAALSDYETQKQAVN